MELTSPAPRAAVTRITRKREPGGLPSEPPDAKLLRYDLRPELLLLLLL
jgi:hypothetical protein